MIVLSYIVNIVVSMLLLFIIIKKNIKGKYEVVDFAIYVYMIFFIVPVILDVIIGKPTYPTNPGFFEASRDVNTIILYNFIMIFPPIIWVVFKNKYHIDIKKIIISEIGIKNPILLYILFVFMVLPLVILLLSPSPELYLLYGPRTSMMDVEDRDFHSIFRLFIMISLFISIFFVYISKNIYITILFLLPIIGIDIWLHGKRGIVFTMLILLLLVILIKRKIRGPKLIVLGSIIAIFLTTFSMFYQYELRNLDENTAIEQYQNIRTDFGRDDETKLAILRETQDGISILEYRGQSILFSLTFFIPREIWAEKPYPYAQYLTSSMFNVEPKLWGWGMTTSIFGEFIANFSYFGIIMAALFVLFLSNKADKSNNFLFKMFTMLMIMNFLTVHLAAFFSTFIIYLVFSFYLYIKNKRSLVT